MKSPLRVMGLGALLAILLAGATAFSLAKQSHSSFQVTSLYKSLSAKEFKAVCLTLQAAAFTYFVSPNRDIYIETYQRNSILTYLAKRGLPASQKKGQLLKEGAPRNLIGENNARF